MEFLLLLLKEKNFTHQGVIFCQRSPVDRGDTLPLQKLFDLLKIIEITAIFLLECEVMQEGFPFGIWIDEELGVQRDIAVFSLMDEWKE